VEFWKLYLYSLLLTIIFSAVFFTGIISIVMTQSVTDFMVSKDWIQQTNADFLQNTRWLFLLGTLLFSVSALYFFSPLRKKQWGFFSIGAIFATALIIASSSGFSYYVDNFSQYNRLYGSIGTLMVIMLWIYINAFVLIIGFELNMSVAVAEGASMDAENQALSEKG
jgi:membrane protein